MTLLQSQHAPRGSVKRDRKSQPIKPTAPISSKPQAKPEPHPEPRPDPYQYEEDVIMFDAEDVEQVSEFVSLSRGNESFVSGDLMELDEHMLKTEIVPLLGNVSYIIIDTNFALSQLQVLDELEKLAHEFGLTIVVPIEVLRELDGLKNSTKPTREGTIGQLARLANRWIFSCLSDRRLAVRGQAQTEQIDKRATKDDAILDCCLYLQQHHPHTIQVLMSNDKNLCARALLNQILTISYSSSMSVRPMAERIRHENIERFGAILDSKPMIREVKVPIQQHEGPTEQVCRLVYTEVQKVVLDIVHRSLIAEYGPSIDGTRHYRHADMTTLDDAVGVMIRFWQKVFVHTLRRAKPFDEFRGERTPRENSVPESRQLLDSFVEYWGRVLDKLYEQYMDTKQRGALEKLRARWDALARTI